MYSTGAKGSTQTNKRSKLGFKRKKQKKPKRTLVWRTRLFGVPPDSVRCARGNRLQLFTFGFLRSRYAIIHRTVWCATRLSGVPSGATVDSNVRLTSKQCADSSRRVRAAPEGAPDSEQYLFGAAPDCPVPQAVRAPTVETVRTLTVR
jgi:hypothetical protein